MISPHNTQSDSAAVALITKSIQQEAPGSLSLDKAHVVPDVCRREDECTCLQNQISSGSPGVPSYILPLLHPHSSSLCVSRSLSLSVSIYLPWKPITDSATRCRISSVCTRMAGRTEGLDKRRIYSSRFRMAADRQWTHSSVPKTNGCAQPAFLRWIEGSRKS